jgi:hypothetical protein
MGGRFNYVQHIGVWICLVIRCVQVRKILAIDLNNKHNPQYNNENWEGIEKADGYN